MKVILVIAGLLLSGLSASAQKVDPKVKNVLGKNTQVVSQLKTQFQIYSLLYVPEQNLYAYHVQSINDPAHTGGCILRAEKLKMLSFEWIKKDGSHLQKTTGKKIPVYADSLYIQLGTSKKLVYDGVIYGYPFNTYDFLDFDDLRDCVRSKPVLQK